MSGNNPSGARDAKSFHMENVVADLHADTWLWESFFGYDIAKKHRSYIPRNPFGNHIDVPRAREGGLNITGQGVVVHVLRKNNYFLRGESMARRILRGIERNSENLELVLSGSEALAAFKKGKIGVFVGLEGAHILEGRLEAVEFFHSLGISYFTLGHFSENEAVYSSNDTANAGKRLKPFGRELVRELEGLKIMIDIAHVAPGCFWDVMDLVTKPVIASHIGISSVYKLWRNLDDDQIRAVAQSGGVVGIIFNPPFLGKKILKCSLDKVVEHIERCTEVAGEDHVALGSDFDGFITTPEGLEDISCLPNLTERLFQRGHSETAVRKFLGGNFLRVFSEVCN